jgi:trans-aconitate methyltransferase
VGVPPTLPAPMITTRWVLVTFSLGDNTLFPVAIVASIRGAAAASCCSTPARRCPRKSLQSPELGAGGFANGGASRGTPSLMSHAMNRPSYADASGTRFVASASASLRGSQASTVAVFSFTLFLGAFLLFGIQPMFTKMVLPMLGGSPSVWNTAMVFFQGALLLGYAYAHGISRWLSIRSQIVIHVALLLVTVCALPIAVADGWTPPSDHMPIAWLIGLFSVSVGIPFLAVSTTAPLLQRWFSHTDHPLAATPYFLYSSSNLGSILALLSYPVLIEPLLSTRSQAAAWSIGYVLLGACIALCAAHLWRVRGAPESRDREYEVSSDKIGWRRRGHWILLAFAPSSLLLGVTLYITTDLVVAPLLWVLPLVLYLLTFVVVFSRTPLLKHSWMVRVQPFVILPLAVTLGMVPTAWVIFAPLHLLAFFVTAMVCHGELARHKPVSRHLTEFYLWMSVGGVLGGIFSAIVAPLMFHSVVEYPLAIALACGLRPVLSAARKYTRIWDIVLPIALLGLVLWPRLGGGLSVDRYGGVAIVGYAIVIAVALYVFTERPIRFGLGVAAVLFGLSVTQSTETVLLAQERSFFGVNKVQLDPSHQFHVLYHGTTIHGAQYVDPSRHRELVTYFHKNAPIGQLFEKIDSANIHNVALTGLGAGAISCYKRPWQEWTIYEIDPVVVRLARDTEYFSYLSECAPDARIVLGDARLSLHDAPNHHFDLIILDAYSSDTVPVHLATREALALYLDKLAPGGVIAVHISNRYLDLEHVFANLVSDAQAVGRIQKPLASSETERRAFLYAADWVVIARRDSDLAFLDGDYRWRKLAPAADTSVWTDDFSNIVQSMRWLRRLWARLPHAA